jgi:hypothetical protein
MVEYGIGWKWSNDVNAAARDSARTGTSEPVYQTSDRSILLSIGTSISQEQLDNLQRVVVFKASSVDGKVPTDCKSLAPSTSSPGAPRGFASTTQGYCNVYGPKQIAYVLANPTVDTPWINSGGNGCDSSDVDANWCPAKRNRNLTTDSFDYIGVYIEVKKPSTTNAGFGKMTIKRTAVFQLEPAFGGD